MDSSQKNYESSDKQEAKIIIFFRSATQGQVKTRIASRIGDRNTFRLYRAMIQDLLQNLSPLREEIIFYEACEGKKEGINIREIVLQEITGYELRHQRGVGLGERMYNAFFDVFRDGAYKAVLIGTDIPHIDSDLLRDYMEKLEQFPVVIGPSTDGGYYLIGFRRDSLSKSIFEGVTWSTSAVLNQTLSKIHRTCIDAFVGEELLDIDHFEDLRTIFNDESLKSRVPRVYGEYKKQLKMQHQKNSYI